MKKISGQILQKLGLKHGFLKIYFFIYRVLYKTKYAVRKKIIPAIVHHRQKTKVFAIDIRNEYGIGAKLSWCIEIFKYCEENGLKPAIRFSYPGNSKDYFSTYFLLNTPELNSPDIIFTPVHFLNELGFSKSYGDEMDFCEGSRLFLKYIGLKDFAEKEADDFFNEWFYLKKILGVHYRGTDKSGEAPEVPYQKVKRNIDFALSNHIKADAVFLSTDDQQFAEYLTLEMKSTPVLMRHDYKRSSDKRAIHLNKNFDKYEVNRDAVINMILLSKCDFLIKSSSFLSDMSKLMNPTLPTVILNKPYENAFWFPAKEILKIMAFDPVD